MLNRSPAAGGNQRQRPNPSSNVTTDALVSPVTAEDLAYFIGMDTPDVAEAALLDEFLLVACEQFIAFANHELLSRDYTLRFDRNSERQPGYSGISPVPALLDWWTILPLTPVSAVTEVRLNDEVTDSFETDLDTVPARVILTALRSGSVEIDYAAGYSNVAEIPPSILTGIKFLSAYLFDHRGGCDVASAVSKSGAESVWFMHKMLLGPI